MFVQAKKERNETRCRVPFLYSVCIYICVCVVKSLRPCSLLLLLLYENISWSTSMDFSSGKPGMCSL